MVGGPRQPGDLPGEHFLVRSECGQVVLRRRFRPPSDLVGDDSPATAGTKRAGSLVEKHPRLGDAYRGDAGRGLLGVRVNGPSETDTLGHLKLAATTFHGPVYGDRSASTSQKGVDRRRAFRIPSAMLHFALRPQGLYKRTKLLLFPFILPVQWQSLPKIPVSSRICNGLSTAHSIRGEC